MTNTETPLFTAEQVAKWTQGTLLQGRPSTPLHHVIFDSRKASPQSLFVALVAERDGHDFIPQAIASGASAILISNPEHCPKDQPELPVILVNDTLEALGTLASQWRRKNKAKIIGITGSNGKTTTKEMLGQIMQRVGSTLQTSGNFNNLIGLPMTLFQLRPEHQFAILEMGMNAFGEIARLAEIAAPKVGVITCVAAAHLEGLGSIEGVARAKGELFAALPPDGIAIINADDPYVLALHKTLHCRRIYFSARSRAHSPLPDDVAMVTLESYEDLGTKGFQLEVSRPCRSYSGEVTLQTSKTETLSIYLPMVGQHQVSNALAAIAAATALNAPSSAIIEGLANIQPTGRRMRLVETTTGVTLIDDCYNSNPNSARAALQTLAELRSQTTSIAVLGDMLELGSNEKQAHASVGRFVAALKIDFLFTFGKRSLETAQAAIQAGMSKEHVFHSEDIDELWQMLTNHLSSDSWVLVKGSRGMRLERISERIEAL